MHSLWIGLWSYAFGSGRIDPVTSTNTPMDPPPSTEPEPPTEPEPSTRAIPSVEGFAALRAAFDRVPGYLDAATMGLPPRAVVRALRESLDEWRAGHAKAPAFDAAVTASRQAYARLVGVAVSEVAVGAQVSLLTGLVAANLPDGAEVVTVEGDFASVVFPFLVHADRGITVRQVPLEGLAGQLRPGTALVAFSLVQSGDGRVADVEAIREAAKAVGASTFCDTTQAVGWLPVRAGDFDVTVCGTYKWLCSPRGTAFLTVSTEYAQRLRPIHAGWYAGESVWDSVYGPDMQLADDARRFDVSPSWLAWVGTAPALQLFADADPAAVYAHDLALADAFRTGLGLQPQGRAPRGSAVVALSDPDGDLRRRLLEAGCVVAGRAGRVRIAFHVWNDHDDVTRALTALRR
jgi:selenocysteine lyase/cysteine desulfurase